MLGPLPSVFQGLTATHLLLAPLYLTPLAAVEVVRLVTLVQTLAKMVGQAAVAAVRTAEGQPLLAAQEFPVKVMLVVMAFRKTQIAAVEVAAVLARLAALALVLWLAVAELEKLILGPDQLAILLVVVVAVLTEVQPVLVVRAVAVTAQTRALVATVRQIQVAARALVVFPPVVLEDQGLLLYATWAAKERQEEP